MNVKAPAASERQRGAPRNVSPWLWIFAALHRGRADCAARPSLKSWRAQSMIRKV
jgi:hypothetical protein